MSDMEKANLMDMIEIVKSGTCKKVTTDFITLYKVGDLIRIDIKEDK